MYVQATRAARGKGASEKERESERARREGPTIGSPAGLRAPAADTQEQEQERERWSAFVACNITPTAAAAEAAALLCEILRLALSEI